VCVHGRDDEKNLEIGDDVSASTTEEREERMM
jgi:hypothetical protein